MSGKAEMERYGFCVSNILGARLDWGIEAREAIERIESQRHALNPFI